jgi:hypothetical protein
MFEFLIQLGYNNELKLGKILNQNELKELIENE